MWPFKRRPSAFEAELAAVRALPEPSALAVSRDALGIPTYEVTVEPPLVPPLREDENKQSLFAQPPIIDRFPIIHGEKLTGAIVSSQFRLCNQGWRYGYVDLLDELLENDPDARAVVRARVLGVACGRYTVEPAKLGKSATDAERDVAQSVADGFALQWENIPFLRQKLQQLAWADWYGLAAHEIKWEHPQQNQWDIAELSHIHNRRLNYTSPTSWDLHIYDQGLVGPGSDYMGPTVGVYGLPVSKFPGKFLTHIPALSGQYPTRDGEGRYVAFFLLIKRMVTRCTAQDFERVIRPWVLGYFNRAIKAGAEAPVADKDDIQLLNAAMQAFGSGSMNAAALPNTVKVELLRAAAAMNATEFLSFLNRSIAKALLGQAFTTEPGPNGNLATAEVADGNTSKVLEYSADALAESIKHNAAMVWMRLNHPGLPRYFCPRIVADVSKLPGPQALIEMAAKGTSIGMPIELSDLASRTTFKLVAPDDEETPRTRMVAANAGPNPPDPNAPNSPNSQEQPAGNAKPKLVAVKPQGKAAAPTPET